MKTKLLASLKTKFSGVDEAILSRIADEKANGITEEEQINSVLEGISFQDVLNSYGDYRANSATQTAVSNYERKHGIKDGKPIEDPKTDPKTGNESVAEMIAEAVSNAISPLTEKIAAFEAEKAQQTRNAQILDKAKEYGIPESLAKMLKIEDEADLDVVFKDAQQTFANAGFSGVIPPSKGAEQKNEADEIAQLIAQDTAKRTERK